MVPCTASQILQRYWGYDKFLPLQQEAIASALAGRNSLVVMPTGGGKSVCYQIPALIRGGVTIIVSPLIALMKDQVDALHMCGIPAESLHGTLPTRTQERILRDAASGRLRLLYVAPERLLSEQTLAWLNVHRPAGFAVDEAHCISTWGHDFRPEYRSLRLVRQRFANVPWQALTATATPRVRDDIIAQLDLAHPDVFVGDFHRSNLVYHVRRRSAGWNQICEVMEHHRGEPGIIYAIARDKVEQLSDTLNRLGFRTLPYHAGMTDQQRNSHQEAFVNDRIDAIVATVAFGMGIDKPNVRFVIHAEMPRSIESYVQESGRAGRDALAADCWLFHAAQDYQTWQRIIENTAPEHRQWSLEALHDMHAYCHSTSCRHRLLVEHFGQTMDGPCASCDVCLGRMKQVTESLRIAQMILSCVLRCREKFGAEHIAKVLTGSRESKLLQFGHNTLSTWGLLKEIPRPQVRDWIDQLLVQQYLRRHEEFSVLKITDRGREALRGESEPILMETLEQTSGITPSRIFDSWEGVDRELFERLRQTRIALAAEAGVAAFVVLSDATLRDLARRRPTTIAGLLAVHGIGQYKAAEYGGRMLEVIKQWCSQKDVTSDVAWQDTPSGRSSGGAKKGLTKGAIESFALWDRGLRVEQVAEQMGRALSTTYDYLEQYILCRKLTDPTRWVDPLTVERIEVACSYNDTGRLKPVFEALHQQVGYELIRIVVACLSARTATSACRDPGPP